MTAGQFLLGFMRLAALVVPAAVIAHRLRTAHLRVTGPPALLAEVVIGLSTLLLSAELLGLVALDRPAALIPLLSGLAVLTYGLTRPGAASPPGLGEPATPDAVPAPSHDLTLLAAGVGVVVVAAQWCLETANSLGSGMSNFDTLWYHMPFAARLAQSSSVTGIQFTQADPFVAYYPANSELFHAIGITALHNDFLSPLLNLAWLALGLLAAWCLGRPWHVSRLTLLAGCLVFSLPVLAATQPGEAFNDTIGLATLLAAAALVANAPDDGRLLAVAGLALGLAAGTKFTFIVPALVLAVGVALRAPRGARGRVLAVIAVPGLLTGGWWYLHDLIETGNPLGLRLHLGPVTLPGPRSPLAEALQQTVISQISHLSLWGSRFAPGLHHAIGPLWPLVLLLYAATAVCGILLVRSSVVRVLAATAALTGIAYLFLPTGASNLEQGANLFEVNLRYITPALVIGVPLLPILAQLRAPRLVRHLAPALAAILLVTQLEHHLWPTQASRHLALLLLRDGRCRRALARKHGAATLVGRGDGRGRRRTGARDRRCHVRRPAPLFRPPLSAGRRQRPRRRADLPLGPGRRSLAHRALWDGSAIPALRRGRHQLRRLPRRTRCTRRLSPDPDVSGVAERPRRGALPLRRRDHPRPDPGGAHELDPGRPGHAPDPSPRGGRVRLSSRGTGQSSALPVTPTREEEPCRSPETQSRPRAPATSPTFSAISQPLRGTLPRAGPSVLSEPGITRTTKGHIQCSSQPRRRLPGSQRLLRSPSAARRSPARRPRPRPRRPGRARAHRRPSRRRSTALRTVPPRTRKQRKR